MTSAIEELTEAGQYAAFLETVPDAMVEISGEGLILAVNKPAEGLFGYPRGEMIGQSAGMLTKGADEEQDEAEAARRRAEFFAGSTPRPMGSGVERMLVKKDGSEFPAEISLAAIDLDGQRILAVAIRDVSERVQVQRERDRLEAQHERDRLEWQLHQSQRLESLGQLAGGVAHDFNNLLAAILNYVNFAKEEIRKQIEQRSLLEAVELEAILRDVTQIGTAAERAARLTHQLLAFGRREVIKLEVLNINALVQEMENLLRRAMGEQVELVTDCQAGIKAIQADRGQMEQVLLNLVVNARDAMPSGGTLTIETREILIDAGTAALQSGLKEGPHLRLRVSDTGEGMGPDTVVHAFEPFFTTKAKDKGSGLGLATVYGIVAQMGGTVSLYSEEGLGTTVTIFLPNVDLELTPPEVVVQPGYREGGETILVVEDEELVREVAQRILVRNGYRVLVARNGAEAVALMIRRGSEVDLLLTDVVMPGMSGNELAERVGRRFPRVKILYMSGYPETVISSQGVVEEGIRLISKPFVEPELLESVREVLDE